eukprot:TRINITY_DN1038_c0_g1_i1.p1 TRINITY_DN1038_c0_g1~~TRINITY_DN1038_c0_g1_i1.p1  ORF type:complete len:237 (-),score=-1.99 TRINITY_DN1038_c0_g1_i1:719-1429(-)
MKCSTGQLLTELQRFYKQLLCVIRSYFVERGEEDGYPRSVKTFLLMGIPVVLRAHRQSQRVDVLIINYVRDGDEAYKRKLARIKFEVKFEFKFDNQVEIEFEIEVRQCKNKNSKGECAQRGWNRIAASAKLMISWTLLIKICLFICCSIQFRNYFVSSFQNYQIALISNFKGFGNIYIIILQQQYILSIFKLIQQHQHGKFQYFQFINIQWYIHLGTLFIIISNLFCKNSRETLSS